MEISSRAIGFLNRVLRYSSRGFFELIVLALVFVTATPDSLSWWLGMGVTLAGTLVRVWSAGYRRRAKKFFVAGPYRFVRHPYYLGTFLVLLGFALIGRNPLVMAVLLIGVTLIYRQSMREEEELLESAAGPLFAKYRATVPLFIPQVWPVRSSDDAIPFSFRYGVFTRKRREIDSIVGIALGVGLLWICKTLPEKFYFHLAMLGVIGLFLLSRVFYYRKHSFSSHRGVSNGQSTL